MSEFDASDYIYLFAFINSNKPSVYLVGLLLQTIDMSVDKHDNNDVVLSQIKHLWINYYVHMCIGQNTTISFNPIYDHLLLTEAFSIDCFGIK